MRNTVLATAQDKDGEIGSIGVGGVIHYLGMAAGTAMLLVSVGQLALPFMIGMPWFTAVLGCGIGLMISRQFMFLGDTIARSAAFFRLISWKFRKVNIKEELGLSAPMEEAHATG